MFVLCLKLLSAIVAATEQASCVTLGCDQGWLSVKTCIKVLDCVVGYHNKPCCMEYQYKASTDDTLLLSNPTL